MPDNQDWYAYYEELEEIDCPFCQTAFVGDSVHSEFRASDGEEFEWECAKCGGIATITAEAETKLCFYIYKVAPPKGCEPDCPGQLFLWEGLFSKS